ncbi:MAG TPA: recombinase family protein [Bryobacteraceae bacterium]|nr:recombinase family protein [Bryobacteraceae bacterium]
MANAAQKGTLAPLVRCAIYTRKSTEEGLDQEFNSLMAQREAAEACIVSQRELGWKALPEPYDDGGFSGGNIDRPALKRLLADVTAKRVDCVVVYKVDRLSRSLLDFAGIIGLLDQHGVSFVSVTQQFNTHTSLGRLTLNILLSFAQFEREIISERTRDKMWAARRKGKWTGGYPVLGYEVDAVGGKLNVNQAEALQVRKIFRIFVSKGTLMETLSEMRRRGIGTKSWTTRKGSVHAGKPFNRHTLEYLLSNEIYIGKVRLKGELHHGEHSPIIDLPLWREVQERLKAAKRSRPDQAGQPQGALLRGLLFCEACGTPMVPACTTKKNRRHRYYTCLSAQKKGWKTCPSRALPARRIEDSVIERLGQLRPLGADPARCPDRRYLMENLVERVTLHGGTGQVRITLTQAARCRREESMTEVERRTIVFHLPSKKTPPPARRTKTRAGRLPRIARLMALAIRFDQLLRNGTVKDYADLARLGRVSRARITQIMNLLNLAPDIQEGLLFLEPVRSWRDALHERAVREVVKEISWERQRKIFAGLLSRQSGVERKSVEELER